jgi:hypothetical protein
MLQKPTPTKKKNKQKSSVCCTRSLNASTTSTLPQWLLHENIQKRCPPTHHQPFDRDFLFKFNPVNQNHKNHEDGVQTRQYIHNQTHLTSFFGIFRPQQIIHSSFDHVFCFPPSVKTLLEQTTKSNNNKQINYVSNTTTIETQEPMPETNDLP